MFADTLSYQAALIAGLLSFFSPCILPLIPAYFSFITGYSADELTRDSKEKRSPSQPWSMSQYFLPMILVFLFMLIFIQTSAIASQINWQGYDQGILKAKEKNKNIFLYFHAEQGHKAVFPELPPSGSGNKIFLQLCEEYQLDPEVLAADLRLKGLKIDLDKKLKIIADENQISPIKLYDLIKQVSERERK